MARFQIRPGPKSACLRGEFQCVSVVCASGTAPASLDPPTAVLLLASPGLGVMLTVAIITSDVAHNAWGVAMYVIEPSA